MAVRMETSISGSKAQLLASLETSEEHQSPYRHWNLRQLFSAEVVAGLNELPLEAAEAIYAEGFRAENNKLRVYFSGENLLNHPVCRHVADLFRDREVIRMLADFSGAEIEGSHLRMEYAQDCEGFWLTPHTDIGAKFFTLLIYLNDPPSGEDWGTDIYVDAETHYGASPFESNAAFMFVPGDNTWHGFEKKPISGLRRSLIVNYVTTEWRARHELAFPEEVIKLGTR